MIRVLTLILVLCARLALAACSGTDAYSVAVCADSPSARWRMDASSGTSETDQVGGSSGTYSGGFTLSQTGIIGAGTDKAVAFGSGTGAMAVSNSSNWYPSTTNGQGWSVEFWAHLTATGRLVMVSSAATIGWWLANNSGSGDINVDIRQSNCTTDAANQNGGSGFGDGSYHHVVMTTVGNGTNLSSLKVYLDASVITTITSFTGSSICGGLGAENLTIAHYLFGAGTFIAATVDELAFYTAALSQAQVTAHYNAGATLPTGGLNAYSVKRHKLPRETSLYSMLFMRP